MLRTIHTRARCAVFILLFALIGASVARAQGTAFTYQGRLTEGGAPANANYDLQFTLWDALVGGTQQPQPAPPTVTKTNVPVTGGVFSVLLDFGVNAFPGTDRFLEVGVKPAGSPNAFTILSPRQQISSTPYAIHTLSATAADSLSSACVGCVTDVQINSVAASKLTGTIPASSLPSDSPSYIQNKTTLQSNANFNISGNGLIGGSAGIGTTSPSANLSVVKSGAPEPAVLGVPTAMKVAAPSGSVPFALRQNADESGTPTLAWFETANGGLGYLGASSSTFAVGGASGKQLALKVNGSTTAMTLATNGNVGIGTLSPAHRLSIAGGPPWTTTGWAGAVELTNASAIGWQANAAGNRFGIGHSGGGLYFFRTTANPGTLNGNANYDMLIADSGNVGIGTISPESKLHLSGRATLVSPFRGLTIDQTRTSISDLSGYSFQVRTFFNDSGRQDFIIDSAGKVGIGTADTTFARLVVRDVDGGVGFAIASGGNVVQDRNKSGFVKAMALVKDDGTGVRCFNSNATTDAAIETPPCNIKVTYENDGSYRVDFGFPVSDRFISLTPRTLTDAKTAPIDVTAVVVGTSNQNQVKAYFRSPTAGARSGFFIFVY